LRQLERLAELGYTFKTGPELEFFLFEKNGDEVSPLPHDRAGYFDYSSDLAYTVRKDMVKALEDMGIEVEASHHEVAIGQHEIDFEYGDAIVTADRATTFKSVLKATAQQHGLHATFMPNPIEGINGSGMHVHMSMGFVDKKGNAFVDEDDSYGLSKTARHFIAGLLAHARGMSGVLSRRSSIPTAAWCRGYEARFTSPGHARTARRWSACRRSAAATRRQPRVELRCPDPPATPTLRFAVMLAAGMDGIERELSLPEPVEENLYHFTDEDLERRNIPTLPSTLGEAVAEMKADPLIREALGDHVFERLTSAQQSEWDDFRKHVTQWERDRYLETY
jgi:glutamine synthetase